MWRAILLSLLAMPAMAETVVATRTIRAMSVLGPEDVAIVKGQVPGTLGSLTAVLGQEARVTLYAGRPIRAQDVGPPAIVERNQIVPLAYLSAPLAIRTEGRALARAGVGDTIRVMNLASRSTVTGRVREDGTVVVGP
jgi:flagellar basal body P-ring formation protein FlgA